MNVTTSPEFWDCECPSDQVYIHFKSDEKCYRCGAKRENQPDSIEAEIQDLFKIGMVIINGKECRFIARKEAART